MGVNHSTKGTETVNAINNLALITGNIGRAGAVAVLDHRPVQRDGHARGRLRVGPARLSQVRERRRTARSWRRLWNVAGRAHPDARAVWPIPTSSRPRSSKKIRALWIIATNPIVSFPNLDVLKQALDGLEFLVVQDGFHPTPTSELRRPGAAGGDLGREGRHLHQLRAARQQGQPAVAPPGEARSDFDIFLGARRGARRARRAVSRDGRRPTTRSRNGSASRPAGCATTPA